MPSLDASYPEIRSALIERYGEATLRLDEAPPFRAIVAVLLGRSLDSRTVEHAITALVEAGLLEPAAMGEAEPSEIGDLLRSSGAKLTPKAIAPLIKVARWAVERDPDAISDRPTESIRDDLIAINGIGPATADAILLEALDRPVYPLDRASYRIFARHGWIDTNTEYDEARDVFERLEPGDPDGLRQLSRWLDRVGSEFCRASRAKCERCPLRPFLPEGGPYEASGE